MLAVKVSRRMAGEGFGRTARVFVSEEPHSHSNDESRMRNISSVENRT